MGRAGTRCDRHLPPHGATTLPGSAGLAARAPSASQGSQAKRAPLPSAAPAAAAPAAPAFPAEVGLLVDMDYDAGADEASAALAVLNAVVGALFNATAAVRDIIREH